MAHILVPTTCDLAACITDVKAFWGMLFPGVCSVIGSCTLSWTCFQRGLGRCRPPFAKSCVDAVFKCYLVTQGQQVGLAAALPRFPMGGGALPS